MDLEGIRKRIAASREEITRACNELLLKNPSIVLPLEKKPFSGTVAAIDSGFASIPLYGMDVLVFRASGVLFPYENSKRTGCTYFPKYRTAPNVETFISDDAPQAGTLMQLSRLKAEIMQAIEIVKAHSPAIILLDGSIAPLASDKPFEAHELYAQTIQAYKELYELCKGKTILASVVKDARGKRFSNEFLEHCQTSDSFFMSILLKEGQRTCDIPTNSKANAITKDLGISHEELRCMYVRPSEDTPIRVEFLSGNDSSYVACVLCELCGPSKIHTYPPVLIEADLRAKLEPNEIEQVTYELEFGAGIKKLKRDSRPFR